MNKRSSMKRFVAYLLAVCMVLSSLCLTDIRTVEAAATDSTTVYFYNAYGWEKVGAYVYGASTDDPLGGWPGTEMEADESLGEGWYSVTVPAAPKFNIVIFNTDKDDERAELEIPDAEHVYVSVDGKAHESSNDAEKPVTTVRFLNNSGWDDVYAYVYTDTEGEEPLGGFPGTAAKASDTGKNWYEVSVPAWTPFNIIFNDNDESQFDFRIEDNKKLYASTDGEVNGVYATKAEAEKAVGMDTETVVYFLNNNNWEDVGAYVYGQGEPLGGWPGETPESAEDEIGEGWMKVVVPANPPFNVIFSNQTPGGDQDIERTELQIKDKTKVYVTGSNEVFGSSLEAELATGMGDPSKMSTVYFYNSRGWMKVKGYTFTKEPGKETDKTAPGTVLGTEWPGKAADSAAEELGEGWWKLKIPKTITEDDKVLVTFNDGVNQTEEDALLTRQNDNYVIPTGAVYSTKEEAEEAAKNVIYEDGNESGPNNDIDSYSVEYNGAGANLPYITYEAEAADTNAEVLEKDTTYSTAVQSEASGRQAVILDETGDYVEFTLMEPANSLVLRYSMPDSEDGNGIDAGLNLYINGEKSQTLSLTSKYAWIYGTYPYTNTPSQGKPHRFFDETKVLFDATIPAGAKIRLQKDADNTAENYTIDFIECEQVAAPLTQPEGSLSVTEYGAVADDGQDDYEAFAACMKAAGEAKKEVWIPEGTFDLKERKSLEVKAVTVRGAGMWYTNLAGEGAAFKLKGTCKFYDFAMTGMATVRRDSEDLAGFEPNEESVNTTIQNIWMEHMKVGVWSANTKNLAIQGCRIRNTYADGINLCSMTNGAVVRNNNVRNTGDDGIAIWPWLADCTSNTIAHNTVQLPMLANGIAVYGGGNNSIEGNYCRDIINNGSGICIGSDYTIADGYHDITTVRGNILERCGSYQTDENYPVGALWVWSTKNPIDATYDIQGNTLLDSSYEGFLFDCKNTISGVTLKDNRVSGATNAVVAKGVKGGVGTGSATIENLTLEKCSDSLIDNQIPDKFTISGQDSIKETKLVKSVTLDQKTLELKAGESATLKATVEPKDATVQDVEWKTSDPAVATVEGGVVTAKKAGRATIMVTTKDGGFTATCKVTVTSDDGNGDGDDEDDDDKKAVTGVKLDKETLGLKAGESATLKATVEPHDATVRDVEWKTSDAAVATVEGGVVTAKKAGEATITVTTKDGGFTATCKVTVTADDGDKQEGPEIKVAKIVLTGISHKIAAGKKITLTATVTPKDAANCKVNWTTSNPKYATVNAKGVVKVKKAGAGKSVTIKATATDGSGISASYKIKIMKKAVTKVKLKADKSVKAGKNLKIKATVTAKKGANKKLKWTSSNTKYATVTSKGVVKTKKAGKGKRVKITAQATDGSGKKASVRIKIK